MLGLSRGHCLRAPQPNSVRETNGQDRVCRQMAVAHAISIGLMGQGPRLVVSGPMPPAQAAKYPGPCDPLQPEGKGRVPRPAARGQCGCDRWADESLSAGSCCLSPTPTFSSSVAKTGDSSPRAHGPQIPPLEVETKINPQRQACLLVRLRLPG